MGWAKRLGAFTSGFAAGFVPTYTQAKQDENRIREEGLRQMNMESARQQAAKDEEDRSFNRDVASKTGTVSKLGVEYGVQPEVAVEYDAQAAQRLEMDRRQQEVGLNYKQLQIDQDKEKEAQILQLGAASAHAADVLAYLGKNDYKGAKAALDLLREDLEKYPALAPQIESMYYRAFNELQQADKVAKDEGKAAKQIESDKKAADEFGVYRIRMENMLLAAEKVAKELGDPTLMSQAALAAIGLARTTEGGYNLSNNKLWKEGKYEENLMKIAVQYGGPSQEINSISSPIQELSRWRADSTATAQKPQGGLPVGEYREYGPEAPGLPSGGLSPSGSLPLLPAIGRQPTVIPSPSRPALNGSLSGRNDPDLTAEDSLFIQREAAKQGISFDQARRLLEDLDRQRRSLF